MIITRKSAKFLIYTLLLLVIESQLIFGQLNPDQQELIKQLTQLVKENKANNQLKMAAGYSNKRAMVYLGAGNYEQAIESYLESTAINDQIGNDDDNKKIYNNIAMIYAEMNQFKNSIKYFEKSLFISRRTNNKKEIAVSLMDISTILMYNKQYDKAIEYLEEALRISNDQDDFNGLISSYDLLSKCYKESGNASKSEEYHKKYLTLDQMRKEGKTDISNKSDRFLKAESEDVFVSKPKQNETELIVNLPEDLSEGLTIGTKDSMRIAINQSRAKAIELHDKILINNKEISELKLKIANAKSEKNKIILFTAIITIALIIMLILIGIYLLRKKQKQINELEQKLSNYKREANVDS